MLNPIMAFSATRRMRSFRTLLIVIAYVAALLLLALAFLGQFHQIVVTSVAHSDNHFAMPWISS